MTNKGREPVRISLLQMAITEYVVFLRKSVMLLEYSPSEFSTTHNSKNLGMFKSTDAIKVGPKYLHIRLTL